MPLVIRKCTQCGGPSYSQPCYPGEGKSPHWYSLEEELRDSLSALNERMAVLEDGDKPRTISPVIIKKQQQQKGGTPLG